MNTAKLIALLMVSFIATGSVIYQIRARRPGQSSVVLSPPGTAVPAPKAPSAGPGATPASSESIAATQPDQNVPRPNIPANGWGRNPFLTLDEISKLNQPDQPVALETPVQKPVVEPPTLPSYAVTGIISGNEGNWAIIDGRTLRPGSRLGSETVKEVKDRGVVLEHQGHLRELPLKSLEETAAAAAPKKEAKQ